MKKKLRNRFVSLFLAVVFVLCASVPAGAVSPVQGWITDSDLFIGEEAAKYIAEFFVRDMIETGTTFWNSETAVTKLVPLYDETGENVVSYTAELTQGYLVISAYADVPSIVLEWADEAEPIYEELPLQENSKIIYAGGLDYFADQGGNTVVSVDGIAIPKQKLSCGLMELRSPDNIPAKLAEAISETKQAVSNGETGVSPQANGSEGDIIDDVWEYARTVYGDRWVSNGYANHWESYAHFARTRDFDSYKGVTYNSHCGPVAITNIIKMYGNKYNPTIKGYSKFTVFEKVIAASKTATPNYYINSPVINLGGTKGETANKFIEAAFRQVNVPIGTKVKTFGPYTADNKVGNEDEGFINIKNCTTGDRLMYLMLDNYGLKENSYAPDVPHHVVGYAYNQLTDNNGYYLTFIKICYGFNTSGRYLDMQSIRWTPYWEVKFY